MSMNDEPPISSVPTEPSVPSVPPVDLSGRLAVSEAGDGFAYVPGRLLAIGPDARARVLQQLGRSEEDMAEADAPDDAPEPGVSIDLGEETLRILDVPDELAIIEELRAEGYRVQPEHVLVAHGPGHGSGCGHGCGPHPAQAFAYVQGAHANPMYANPMYANPMYANPMYANPMYANPFVASLFPGERLSSSTAVPARRVDMGTAEPSAAADAAPRIVVLDTGVAGGQDDDELNVTGLAEKPVLPSLVADSASQASDFLIPAHSSSPQRISGAWDVADMPMRRLDSPPAADGYLDPVAGHGTFIAGIIEQLAPGCTIVVQRVVDAFGYVDEGNVVELLNDCASEAHADDRPSADIVVMSFGGHLSDQSYALRAAVAHASCAGIVMVASAGNEGSCVPNYPAAFDDVVAVGAVGPGGPAPWSNYGPWVDACAPGVDLVSAFFQGFDGNLPMVNGIDPDRFEGWARWSGTSFAAPVVAAALAREMVVRRCDAKEAVQRVIRARHLLRVPCLGTVVNI